MISAHESDYNARYDAMVASLDYLIDVNYEDKIRGRLKRTINRHLNVLNVQILYSRKNPNNFHLDDVLDHAMDVNLLSEAEWYDMALIDFVLLGQTEDEEPAYVVIESSVTITDRDVDRTARRARVLTVASGVAKEAVVIRTTISDADREHAAQSGVTVIIMEK